LPVLEERPVRVAGRGRPGASSVALWAVAQQDRLQLFAGPVWLPEHQVRIHKAGSWKMKKSPLICAGIDTGKSKLDVAIDSHARRIGIEASGGYERTIVAKLRMEGFEVIVFQPKQVCRVHSSIPNLSPVFRNEQLVELCLDLPYEDADSFRLGIIGRQGEDFLQLPAKMRAHLRFPEGPDLGFLEFALVRRQTVALKTTILRHYFHPNTT
jgi:hypothetical protein